MRFYYSRKQARNYGYNYLLDNDGFWKRYTEITNGRESEYDDAVCVYESEYYPLLKIRTDYGIIYARSAPQVKYMPEQEIQHKLNVIMKNIDKALIENDKERFNKLSKKYYQLKQQL